MTEITKHEEGMFSWADLGTTDIEAAKNFYVDLFGWHAESNVIPDDGSIYVMFMKDGNAVAAAYQQREDQRQQGLPPYWGVYFTVYDLEQRTKQAEASGGTIIAPPFDVLDAGRMSAIADPNGAPFSLWEPKENIGAEVMDEPNTLGWSELSAPDADKAKAFYTEVLPWTSEDMDMGPGGTYTLFKVGDTSTAGMYPATPETGNMASWTIYFDVADCDATVARLQSLGGRVMMPAQSAPGVGRFAVVADPQGAMFGVLQPEPED